MRQRLTIILLMAFISMTGKAQFVKDTHLVPITPFMTEKAHKPIMGKPVGKISANVPMPKKAASKSPRKVRLSDMTWPLEGFAINTQYKLDDEIGFLDAPIPTMSYSTTIDMVDDNHISFIGLVEGGNVEFTVEVNPDDGSFTIPSGTLVATTDYGNVGIYSVWEDADIYGCVTEDGIYFESLWYEIIVDGENAGKRWMSEYFYETIAFKRKNGIMSFTNSDISSPVDVYIHQDDSKVYVYNFLGLGSTITIDRKENNAFEIPSQLVLVTSNAEFYTYSLPAFGEVQLFDIIRCTGEGNVLTFDSPWAYYGENSETGFWSGYITETTITRTDGVDFVVQEVEVPVTLSTPTMVQVIKYNPNNGFGFVLFDIPTTDLEGNSLDESQLYYTLYSDVDGVVSTITFIAGLYNSLENDLTEIPYTLNDDWDFDISDGHKRVWLYFDISGYDHIGVQSVYYDGDTKKVSEISWKDVPRPDDLNKELIELPDGAEVGAGILNGYLKNENSDNPPYVLEKSWQIEIAFVGNQVYFKGLCDYFPDSWVVGTLNDGVITIPADEYLGEYKIAFSDDSDDVFSKEITFTYDAENKVMTGGFFFNFISANGYYYPVGYDYAEIQYLPFVEEIPATPTITENRLNSSYPMVNINVPTLTIGGNGLPISALWYRLMITRRDGTKFEYTCSPSDYEYLENEMTWVPYTYNDDWDIYTGGTLFYVYDDNLSTWKFIEVQSKYELNGETYYSDTNLYDVDASANVIKVEEMTGGEWSENYWATYYNSHWGYVADANTTVYVASLSHENTQLLLEEVPDKIINPGQAVILRSTSADGFKLNFTTETSTFDFTENALSGVDEATAVPTDQGTIYTLSIKDGRMAFRKFTGSTLGAHKAYLAIASYGDSPIRISFDEGATSISDIAEDSKESDGYYTLDGRHFKGIPTSPGVYIINGEKRVISH